jgi:hypothetical protein
VDGLVLYLGPDGNVRRKLRHFDRDTFVFDDPEHSGALPVLFTIGAGQVARTLFLPALDDMGQGTLPRTGG